MTLHRFYAPALDPAATTVVLDAGESRHLVRVLRLSVGDRVRVFDGRGHECLAAVAAVGRARATLQLLERAEPARETRVRITLAQALLKADAMDAVVRDATMLGVAAIQPIAAARSNVSLAAARRGHYVDRWHRIAVASCKQCGRAVVPEVRPPVEYTEFVSTASGDIRLILAEPSARQPEMPYALTEVGAPASATVLVGPEGGWPLEEVERATSHGFRPVTLGQRTLRADAVPIVALAVLLFAWGDL